MAETSRYFAPLPTKIDTLELDAAVSELGSFDSEVSEHPVERGASVVDHIRPKPVIVRIDGVVSDTPTTQAQVARAGSVLGVSLDAPQLVPGYTDAVLAFLLDLRTNPRLVTIATKRRSYDDMALTSLSVPEDAATGDVLRFTATFRQVRQVTVRRVAFVTATPSTKPKVKAGTKPTATASPEVQNKSILKRLSESSAVNAARRQVGQFFGIEE